MTAAGILCFLSIFMMLYFQNLTFTG
jgi:hypothetical protein